VALETVTPSLVLTRGVPPPPYGSRFKGGVRETGFHALMAGQAPAHKIHNTFVKPWVFTSTAEEYAAMTEAAVVIDVTGEEVIELSGPGAYAVLDRLVPRRLPAASSSRCSYAVMCYPYGGIVEDGIVVPFSNELAWWSGGPAATEQWLYEHSLGTSVTVRSRLDELHVLSIQGPRSRDLVVAAGLSAAARLPYFGRAEGTLCEVPVVATRTGYTAELGFDVYVERERAGVLLERMLEAGEGTGLRRCGSSTLDIRRLEAAILNVGQDFDWRHTPFECGLDWMVALDKEFVGVEALRQHAAAGPRSELVGLVAAAGAKLAAGDVIGGVAAPEAAGDVIGGVAAPEAAGAVIGGVAAPEAAGVLSSATASPELGCDIAIARVRAGSAPVGSSVAVGPPGEPARAGAVVCTLPFVDPKRTRARA